jgi:hypothetical protein
MNPFHQLQVLRQRRIAVRDGLAMLQDAQQDLVRARNAAQAWGVVAVMANVTLIPLNCIINAYGAGTANSAYQSLVRAVYDKFSKSGTRLQSDTVKTTLSVLKTAVAGELKRKGLASQIPGANILIGLAEDSYAAFETMQTVQTGNRDVVNQEVALLKQIKRLEAELRKFGIQEADLMDQAQAVNRTA